MPSWLARRSLRVHSPRLIPPTESARLGLLLNPGQGTSYGKLSPPPCGKSENLGKSRNGFREAGGGGVPGLTGNNCHKNAEVGEVWKCRNGRGIELWLTLGKPPGRVRQSWGFAWVCVQCPVAFLQFPEAETPVKHSRSDGPMWPTMRWL